MELGNAMFGHSRGVHHIERGVGFENEISRLFRLAFPKSDDWAISYGVEFKNDVWECHPYCWCDNEDCPQCGTGEQANFKHYPSGLEICWYKYPLRDAYSNMPITLRKFCDVIDDCVSSLAK